MGPLLEGIGTDVCVHGNGAGGGLVKEVECTGSCQSAKTSFVVAGSVSKQPRSCDAMDGPTQ